MAAIPTPTPRELEILKVLWELGPSTVRAVHLHTFKNQDIAFNTVQTMLRLMTVKKLVSGRLEGRAFIYTPCFSRDESAVRFLDHVFDGEAAEMVQSLIRSERISAEELEQMQELIDEARHMQKGGAA